jgi:hypothetical protein
MPLARVAESRAVPFSSRLLPDYSTHVLAATPTRHGLEYMDWGQDLLADPLVPVRCFTRPRDLPGTGVKWNEPAIARCLGRWLISAPVRSAWPPMVADGVAQYPLMARRDSTRRTLLDQSDD